MNLSIDELMESVGCDRIPDRWRDIYDDAMTEFYNQGCELLNPGYYDMLGEKYNILVKYRDVYKKAAEKVLASEPLSTFLHLICYAMRDRKNAMSEAYELSPVKASDGNENLAYTMLTGLANCSLVPYCYETLKKKDIPDDIIANCLKFPEKGVDEYRVLHNGAYGYSNFGWYQLTINGGLFRVNRLEIEPYSKFSANAVVYANKCGEYVALADNMILHREGFPLGSRGYEDALDSFTATISQNDTCWVGYPFQPSGYVDKTLISLSKDEWEVALSPGDSVVNLHIPSDGDFTPETVDYTIKDIRDFMKKYFPEVNYKAFVCHSWLIDTQLEELLGNDSNIVKFGKRFSRLAVKSNGMGVFQFVFDYPSSDSEPVVSELPENTRLEKAIKNHYLNKKAIYEMYGYFFE